jgi:hypothetical protein
MPGEIARRARQKLDRAREKGIQSGRCKNEQYVLALVQPSLDNEAVEHDLSLRFGHAQLELADFAQGEHR